MPRLSWKHDNSSQLCNSGLDGMFKNRPIQRGSIKETNIEGDSIAERKSRIIFLMGRFGLVREVVARVVLCVCLFRIRFCSVALGFWNMEALLTWVRGDCH